MVVNSGSVVQSLVGAVSSSAPNGYGLVQYLHEQPEWKDRVQPQLTVWIWEKWLTHQNALLPFRKMGIDYWVGKRATWLILMWASVSSARGGITACTNTGLGMTWWKWAQRRRTLQSSWITGWLSARKMPLWPWRLKVFWGESRKPWPEGGNPSCPSTLP